MITAREVAKVLGGDVSHGRALVPGPGHSRADRSLSVNVDPHAPDGFLVHSFAGDDPLKCKDYVRAKLGLPQWQPAKSSSLLNRGSATLMRLAAKPNGHANGKYNGRTRSPQVRSQFIPDLPARTRPDTNGKPSFHAWGEDGPAHTEDELRRHTYRKDGLSVRIKIKRRNGTSAFTNWYRVQDDRGVVGWQAKKPEGYHATPYICPELDPFDPELIAHVLYWPEGERDVDTLAKYNAPAFTFGGVGDGLPDGIGHYLANRHLVVLADNDEPGRGHAEKKAAAAHAAGASTIRIVHFPEASDHGDVTDYFMRGGSTDDLAQRSDTAAPWQPSLEPAPAAQVAPERELIVRRASDIAPEKVEWLWPGRAAIGKVTLIGGEPGLGKSQLICSIAATVTTAGAWPCDEGRAPGGSVLILSAEDDAADTIVPRLIATGADVGLVGIVSSVSVRTSGSAGSRRTFNLQADLDLLEREIARAGDVRLIVIDPISSYLGKTDSHKNADVRATLEPLCEMASRFRVAVVAITHFSKGGGKSAVDSFIGSIAFVAAARAAFIVTRDPDDGERRLFLTAKNNLAKDGGGLAFRLVQQLLPREILASSIAWEGDHVAKTADEVLAERYAAADAPSRVEAEDFLCDVLSSGPRLSKEIEIEAKEAGVAWRTVNRAKKAMGVVAESRPEPHSGGDGKPPRPRWYWRLPDAIAPKAANSAQECHVPDVAALGNFGSLGHEGGLE